MKRIIFTLTLVAAVALTAAARDQWTLNGRVYDVDTLIFPHPVGPGVTFAKFDLPAMPLKVSVMEMDLTNPYIQMETWLGSDRSVGTETPTSVVARHKAAGRDVVGATNGDFYRTSPTDQVGVPTSGQLTNGQVMVAPTGRGSFVLDENRRPYIDRVDFSADYSYSGKTVGIHTMNNPENSGADRTCLFTRAYGPNTYTCATGKLVRIVPKSGSFAWKLNAVEHCEVVEVITANGTATPIPDGSAYLWMQGNHVAHAEALQPGDELDVTLRVGLRAHPGKLIPMKEMLGGSDHIIMRNGNYEDAWDERHPRTCIGFSADSTRVFFVLIDGRSTESTGVTTREAMGIFTALGAVNAVNLDGGGSSCMVVNDEVVNRPSDGPVRSVGNGVLLYSSAPADDNIGMLNFEPRCYNIAASAITRFGVWGYNQYGVLKTRAVEGCTFSADEQVGRFTDDGMFIAAAKPASGNIYAHLGDITVAQPINVVEAALSLRADSIVIDRTHPYMIEVLGQSGYNADLVDPSIFTWTIEDPTVLTLEDNATLRALTDGQTRVFGAANGLADTLFVRVQNPTGTVMPIESPINPDSWNVTQSGGKNRTVTALENGLRIDFTGSSSRNAYIRLSKRVSLWGIPEALRLRFVPGELAINRVTLSTQLPQGGQVLTAFDIPEDHPDTVSVTLKTEDWANADDLSNYPLSLVYIQFGMTPPKSNQQYTLAIPGIEALYADTPPVNPADVNGDGKVDVEDINLVINAVLGIAAPVDVNGDNKTDIEDINLVINYMMGN